MWENKYVCPRTGTHPCVRSSRMWSIPCLDITCGTTGALDQATSGDPARWSRHDWVLCAPVSRGCARRRTEIPPPLEHPWLQVLAPVHGCGGVGHSSQCQLLLQRAHGCGTGTSCKFKAHTLARVLAMPSWYRACCVPFATPYSLACAQGAIECPHPSATQVVHTHLEVAK